MEERLVVCVCVCVCVRERERERERERFINSISHAIFITPLNLNVTCHYNCTLNNLVNDSVGWMTINGHAVFTKSARAPC